MVSEDHILGAVCDNYNVVLQTVGPDIGTTQFMYDD